MANTQMLASLLSGGGTGYTGGSRKRRLAEMLAQQGTDTSPVQHPLQGIARLAQAWAGKSMMDGHGDEATAIADILAPSSYEAGNSGQSVSGTVPFKFSGIGSGSNGIDVDYVSPEQHVAGVKTPSAQKQGGISTEKTIGVEMDGIHYVIPTIINDQTYTPQAAIEAMKTGLIKPLAKFNSQAEADAFAEQRSRDLDTLYGGQGRLMMGAPNPVDGVVHDKYPGQFPSAVEHAISVPIPQITETSDPKRQALISALSSGAVEPGAFQDAIASKLGFGKDAEYSTDPKFDSQGRAYVVAKNGTIKYLDGVTPERDPNKPFYMADGGPQANQQYQNYDITSKRAGAPRTSVTVQAGSSFGTGLGTGAADILKASQAKAESAVATIAQGNEILRALDSGNVMAGPTTTLKKVGMQLFGGDQSKLNATTEVIKGLSEITLQSRGMLKGQGQITEYEQKTLEKARSGNIDDLTTGEIRTIIKVNERLGRATIAANRDVMSRAAMAAGGEGGDFINMFDVPDPPQYTPQSPSQGSGVARVTSDADYEKLPRRSVFIGPDGKQRRKP